ncbi:MAG: relaxase/mobilization nuclease domain-containing protein [Pseudomonadota bacterium]
MIPFASQRGSGRDLATHLLNAEDNEYLEIADLRGAVADDLHGAFAEWEAQAAAMTKCRNYLYSLSVNPDQRQGPLPRELYAAYVDRVEEALGLGGQPRAIVFHIKEGREHAHIVWSRIDLQEMKAIHMAFDHDKLMGVTRSFAREHGIELAPGYHRLEERKRQTHRQLSLYEKAQIEESGISREERIATVTDLWHRRDTPQSFLASLEHHGYLLAHGKRPFVLVDIYGHTNALPKLIDDKAANTQAIRSFLGEAGAAENLPTVEEAKALAARHRLALKEHRQTEDRADRLDALKARQETRRAELEREAETLKTRQEAARQEASEPHGAETAAHSARYERRVALIRDQREAARPTGLAGFLARVSGVAYLREKLHAHQDAKRAATHLEEQRAIAERHEAARAELERRQTMQSLDMGRKRQALKETEARERRSLEKSFLQEARVRQRGGQHQMPSLGLEMAPPGRRAAPAKAMHRHTNPLAREMAMAKRRPNPEKPEAPGKLQKDFEQAARGDQTHAETRDGERGRGSTAPKQERHGERKSPRRAFTRQGRDQGKGRER